MTTPAPTAPPPAPAVAAEPLGRRFHALLGATTAANLGDGILQTAVPL
jgi:hypothetical protein